MNFPPFIESKSDRWVIDLGEADLEENLRYTFPSINDAENDKILITQARKEKGWTIIEETGAFFLEVKGDSIKELGNEIYIKK